MSEPICTQGKALQHTVRAIHGRWRITPWAAGIHFPAFEEIVHSPLNFYRNSAFVIRILSEDVPSNWVWNAFDSSRCDVELAPGIIQHAFDGGRVGKGGITGARGRGRLLPRSLSDGCLPPLRIVERHGVPVSMSSEQACVVRQREFEKLTEGVLAANHRQVTRWRRSADAISRKVSFSVRRENRVEGVFVHISGERDKKCLVG